MWAAILSLLKLGALILGEIFEAKKRARLNDEKFELDQARVLQIFEDCLKRMRDQSRLEQVQAIAVEDRIDEEMK